MAARVKAVENSNSTDVDPLGDTRGRIARNRRRRRTVFRSAPSKSANGGRMEIIEWWPKLDSYAKAWLIGAEGL